jgi:hypothetical protein
MEIGPVLLVEFCKMQIGPIILLGNPLPDSFLSQVGPTSILQNRTPKPEEDSGNGRSPVRRSVWRTALTRNGAGCAGGLSDPPEGGTPNGRPPPVDQ